MNIVQDTGQRRATSPTRNPEMEMHHVQATWTSQRSTTPKAIRNDDVMAFIEMKTRKNEMNKYPTYMISFTKVFKAKQLNQALHLRPRATLRLIQKGPTPWWFTSVTHDCKPSIKIGGRKDRKDPADIDTVDGIPIKDPEDINMNKTVGHCDHRG